MSSPSSRTFQVAAQHSQRKFRNCLELYNPANADTFMAIMNIGSISFGVTQSEIAEFCHVPLTDVCDWITGRKCPPEAIRAQAKECLLINLA